MTARDPIFVGGTVTSPTEARLALAGLVAAGSGGAAARPGILYGPGSPLTVTGTSTMAYSVAAGQGVVVRTASGGAYVGGNDGATTVTTTASPPSGSRYDVIFLQYVDTELDGGTSEGVFGVVRGSSSGSPTVPAVPTGAIALAQALVPSSASRTDTGVTITQVAPYTAARGGVVPFRSATEQSAATAYEALHGYRLDTHKPLVYTGEWAELPAGPAMPAVAIGYGSSGSGYTITATTWTNLPTSPGAASITNPSTARSMLVDVHYSAWLSAAGSSVRAAIDVSGSVSLHANSGTSSLPDSTNGWGDVLIQTPPSSGTNKSQMSATIQVTIPAGGTVTVVFRALRDSATGSQEVDYPLIKIVPLRYV